MSTAAIVVDGVIRKVVGGTPIPDGVRLYYSLATKYNVVLVTDIYYDLDNATSELESWLIIQGMKEHSDIIYGNTLLDAYGTVERREMQLAHLRRSGHFVGLWVDANPSVTAAMVRDGTPTLLFIHPEYSLPEWRPDYISEIAPWNSVEQQIAEQARLRQLDKR